MIKWSFLILCTNMKNKNHNKQLNLLMHTSVQMFFETSLMGTQADFYIIINTV